MQQNQPGVAYDMIQFTIDQCTAKQPMSQQSVKHFQMISINSNDNKNFVCQEKEQLFFDLLKEKNVTKSQDNPKTSHCQIGCFNEVVGKSQGQAYKQKQTKNPYDIYQSKIQVSSISSQSQNHHCQGTNKTNQTKICKICKNYQAACQQNECSPLCVKAKQQILQSRHKEQLAHLQQLQRNYEELVDLQTQGEQTNENYKCRCNQLGCKTTLCGCIERGLQCNQLCLCNPEKCQFYRDHVKKTKCVISEGGSDVKSTYMQFKPFFYPLQ